MGWLAKHFTNGKGGAGGREIILLLTDIREVLKEVRDNTVGLQSYMVRGDAAMRDIGLVKDRLERGMPR